MGHTDGQRASRFCPERQGTMRFGPGAHRYSVSRLSPAMNANTGVGSQLRTAFDVAAVVDATAAASSAARVAVTAAAEACLLPRGPGPNGESESPAAQHRAGTKSTLGPDWCCQKRAEEKTNGIRGQNLSMVMRDARRDTSRASLWPSPTPAAQSAAPNWVVVTVPGGMPRMVLGPRNARHRANAAAARAGSASEARNLG